MATISKIAASYGSILRGNNLKQIVTFPTSMTRGNATFDLILTKIQTHYHKPSPIHILVWAIMTAFFSPFGDSSVRVLGMCIQNQSWNIQNQSWNEVYVSEGSQAKTDTLYSILKEGMDHLPTKPSAYSQLW